MYVYALYTWMWMKPFNSVITLAWIPSICCTGWWEMPSLTPVCVWERLKNEGKLLQISGQLIVTVSTNQRDNLWNQWKPVLCTLAFHYSKGLDFLRCPPPMTLYLSFLPVVSYVSTAIPISCYMLCERLKAYKGQMSRRDFTMHWFFMGCFFL